MENQYIECSREGESTNGDVRIDGGDIVAGDIWTITFQYLI
jgi:hypothetical protein